jgi:glutaredoxin
MKKRKSKKELAKNPWTYAVIIIIVMVIFWIQLSMGSSKGGSSKTDSFAKCLTENGLKMYGTEWCGYCKQQKELFGSSFEYIDYTDCDVDSATCSAEGVGGYPTWKINGESYPGVQQLARLAQLTGCEL